MSPYSEGGGARIWSESLKKSGRKVGGGGGGCQGDTCEVVLHGGEERRGGRRQKKKRGAVRVGYKTQTRGVVCSDRDGSLGTWITMIEGEVRS